MTTPAPFAAAWHRCHQWTHPENPDFASPWVSYIDGAPWMLGANGHALCGVPLDEPYPPGAYASDDPAKPLSEQPGFVRADARNYIAITNGLATPTGWNMTHGWNRAADILTGLGVAPIVAGERVMDSPIKAHLHDHGVVFCGDDVPPDTNAWIAISPRYLVTIGGAESVHCANPGPIRLADRMGASSSRLRVETHHAVHIVMPMRASRRIA